MARERDWAVPFRAELRAYGLSLLGAKNPVDLDDLVQQTLLDAARTEAPHAHREARLAWLKVALKNNLLDEQRRRRAGKRNTAREQPLGSRDPAGKGSSPSRRLKQSEELKVLLKHLKALPPDQREAVRLRFIEELAVEDVAQRMEKTRAAVAGLIRRGLEGLREGSRK